MKASGRHRKPNWRRLAYLLLAAGLVLLLPVAQAVEAADPAGEEGGSSAMQLLLGAVSGICLSAACGFRIFVPPLIMGCFAKFGNFQLADGFEWMSSWPALFAFGAATLVEVAAYYIPWIDNALDTVATPASIGAGITIMAACLGDITPVMKWTLAVVGGGGTTGIFQLLTAAVRAISTATTGGVGNPVVSTVEAGSSIGISILALVIPVVTVLILLLLFVLLIRKLVRRRAAPTAPAPSA